MSSISLSPRPNGRSSNEYCTKKGEGGADQHNEYSAECVVFISETRNLNFQVWVGYSECSPICQNIDIKDVVSVTLSLNAPNHARYFIS